MCYPPLVPPEKQKPSLSNVPGQGLIAHASDACLRHLLRHTAAIVNSVREVGTDPFSGGPADSEVPGTGIPIKWGNHHFVLSAAHVFKNATPKDLRVLTFANLPPTYKGRESLTWDDIVDGLPLTGDCVIHVCDWEDLAVVTINPEKFPGVDFTDPAKEWTDPAVAENVHCCGFPSDHSFRVNKRRVSENRLEVDLAVWPTTFSGEVLPFPPPDELRFRYPDLDIERHYLIPYELPGISQKAGGISGAAVWWESDEKQIIWRPNFKFAGICTHWYPKRARVAVVKASVVRRFLTELFGAPAAQ